MNRFGQEAEDRALVFLQKQGLKLVERNWHCRGGELDLVMREGDSWVFVEVRQRTSAAFGGALASITAEKCRKLHFAATVYLQHMRLTNVYCRFDVVLIQGESGPLWLKNVLA